MVVLALGPIFVLEVPGSYYLFPFLFYTLIAIYNFKGVTH